MHYPLPTHVTVAWKNRDGLEATAQGERLTKQSVTLTMVKTGETLSASEVLEGIKILAGTNVIYEGRGVVSAIIEAGGGTYYNLTLQNPKFELQLPPRNQIETLSNAACQQILERCGQRERIDGEFRLLVGEVSDLLNMTRAWMDQVECALAPEQWTDGWVDDFLNTIAPRITGTFNIKHERFEDIIEAATDRGQKTELVQLHRDFTQTHWQQFFLGNPFGHRTFFKPLGYAGDYEMMSMIHRNRPEGNGLFNRLVHWLLLSQWPALSVRNRIAHLRDVITETGLKAASRGKRAKILNIGCGPAWEVQQLVKSTSLVDVMDFTLLDFNEETLAYAGRIVRDLNQQHGRTSTLNTVKMSVYQLLARSKSPQNLLPGDFDLVYCAGLFDYLSPETCRHLVGFFYDILSPGGTVVVANMNDSKPFANFIEYILDWHLIYRSPSQIRTFAPIRPGSHSEVIHEPTTANLFLHVRKPDK